MGRPLGRSRRRVSQKSARKRLLVVCGAERTEKDYLAGLRKLADNEAAYIVKVCGRSPDGVVDYAVKQRAYAPGDFDETWCVFDVDQFEIRKAVQRARGSQIRVAISNPCFELWLLLHHEQCRAHLAGYEAVRERLRKFVPEYDKRCLRFVEFSGGIQPAVERAKLLDPTGSDHMVNPSTNMWQLVERIRGRS